MRITKMARLQKWMDVPVLEETGWASPMGIAFNEEVICLFATIKVGVEQRKHRIKDVFFKSEV